jgi:hypothetical protein
MPGVKKTLGRLSLGRSTVRRYLGRSLFTPHSELESFNISLHNIEPNLCTRLACSFSKDNSNADSADSKNQADLVGRSLISMSRTLCACVLETPRTTSSPGAKLVIQIQWHYLHTMCQQYRLLNVPAFPTDVGAGAFLPVSLPASARMQLLFLSTLSL